MGMKHGIRLQCLRLQQSLHWGRDCNGSFMAGIIGQDFDGYFGSRMC